VKKQTDDKNKKCISFFHIAVIAMFLNGLIACICAIPLIDWNSSDEGKGLIIFLAGLITCIIVFAVVICKIISDKQYERNFGERKKVKKLSAKGITIRIMSLSAFLLLFNYLLFIYEYEYDDSWKEIAIIAECAGKIDNLGIVVGYSQPSVMPVLEDPYIVIEIESTRSSSPKLRPWRNFSWFLNDERIKDVKTLVFVKYIDKYRETYVRSGSTGVTVRSYETKIFYFNSEGECIWIDTIEAEKLPYKTEITIDRKAGEWVIMRVIRNSIKISKSLN